MKAFIDKIFKAKKQKQEEILNEITHSKVAEEATEAVIQAIKPSKKQIKTEVVEEKVIYSRPGHYFPDCNCFKCVRWKNQNA